MKLAFIYVIVAAFAGLGTLTLAEGNYRVAAATFMLAGANGLLLL